MINENFRFAITPQLGVNDRTAVVTTWYVNDGDLVRHGQPICCLETSKAALDVEADYDGIFKILVDTKESVDINQPLGVFFANQQDYDRLADSLYKKLTKKNVIVQSRATAKALRLAQELGIDIHRIEGNGVIRERDVHNFARKRDSELAKPLEIQLHPILKNIAIYGSGQGANTILENINLRGEYHVVCFLDDDISKIGQKNGLPVIHSKALSLDKKLSNISIALAVSSSDARRRIHSQCNNLGLEVINVIHPHAWVAPSVKMGCGNHIKAGALIDTGTEIRDGCIIDNNTTIAHDNLIDSYSHLAPGVTLASNIVIGQCVIVGTGASVATGVSIGANCIIGVGSAVTKNISAGSVVEGVPARIVGQRLGGH